MKQCTSKFHEGPQEIDESLFGKDKSRKDGLHNHCKKCRYKATAAHRHRLREETGQSPAMRLYYKNHEVNKKKQAALQQKFKKKKGIPWGLLIAVRSRAKRNGLDFDLTEEDLQLPATCPILGIPLVQEYGPICDNYPSVDKIDPTKGYTKDNIQIISWRANNLKNNASLHEMILLGEWAKTFQRSS